MFEVFKNFPLPLTVFSVVLIYGILLPVHQWIDNSKIAIAIVFPIYSAFIYTMVAWYIIKTYRKHTRVSEKVSRWIDGYISVVHAIAGLSMAIVVLSDPIDQHYGEISAGTKGYDLYWTHLLSNVILIFNTAGRGLTAGVSALGVATDILASLTGLFYIMVALSIVLRYISLPRPRPHETSSPYGKKAEYDKHKRNERRGPPPGVGIPLGKASNGTTMRKKQ